MRNIPELSIPQVLRSCGFLAAIGEEVLPQIARTAAIERYSRGDLIFPEGAQCRGMYIVGKGAVKIYKIGPDGREHVIHVAEPGDCFGEAALFLGQGYPAYASAVKDSVLVLLRKAPLLELLEREPELCFKLLGSMSMWTHRLVTKLELLTLRDASSRLASYLLSKAEPVSGRVTLNIPKQTLAAQLDVASETLSRMLNRFEAQAMIEVNGRQIAITDRRSLQELADME
ncbi:MAG: Crp/Fnr family transcriptional regulator [Armatimonadetes bacterium]|nr:Crp/Fnr family transcriptional regulator [Armatimonadota bacterium]